MSTFQDPQGPISPINRVRLLGRQRRATTPEESDALKAGESVPTAGRDMPEKVGMPSMPAQEPQQPAAAPEAAPVAPPTPAAAPTEVQQPQVPQPPKFSLTPEEMANPEFMSKWEDMTLAKKLEILDTTPGSVSSDAYNIELDDETQSQLASALRGSAAAPQEDGEGGFFDWLEATTSAGVSGFLDWIPNTLSFVDDAVSTVGGGLAEMIGGENVGQSYGALRRKGAGNAVRQIFEGPDGRLSLLNTLPTEAVDSIREAQERHPLSSGIAQGVGTIASFMVPGGQASGIGKIGQFSLPGRVMQAGTIGSAAAIKATAKGVSALAQPLTKSAWAQGFKTAIGKTAMATPIIGKPTLATSKYIAGIAQRHGAQLVGTGLGSAYATVLTGDQRETVVDRALMGMAMGAAGYTGYAIANKASGAYLSKTLRPFMKDAEGKYLDQAGMLFKSGLFERNVISKTIGTVIEGAGNSFFDPNIYPALGVILNSANESQESIDKAQEQIAISVSAGYIGALLGRVGTDPAWATLVTKRPDLAGAKLEYDAIALEKLGKVPAAEAKRTVKQTREQADKITEEHQIWQREQQAQEAAKKSAEELEAIALAAAKDRSERTAAEQHAIWQRENQALELALEQAAQLEKAGTEAARNQADQRVAEQHAIWQRETQALEQALQEATQREIEGTRVAEAEINRKISEQLAEAKRKAETEVNEKHLVWQREQQTQEQALQQAEELKSIGDEAGKARYEAEVEAAKSRREDELTELLGATQREQQAQEQALQQAEELQRIGDEAARARAQKAINEGMPKPGPETLLADGLVRAGFRGQLRDPNYGLMFSAPVGGQRIWMRDDGGRMQVTINGEAIKTLINKKVFPNYLPDSLRNVPPDRLEAMASFTMDGPDVPQFVADLGFVGMAAEINGHTALSRMGAKPLDIAGLGVYGNEGQQYSISMDGTVFVKNITEGNAVERRKGHAPTEPMPPEDVGMVKLFQPMKRQPKMPIEPNEHSVTGDAQAWIDFSVSAKVRAMSDRSGRLAGAWKTMEATMYLATHGASTNPYVVEVNKLFEMMPRPSETLPQITASPESFQRLAFVMGSIATGRMTAETGAAIIMSGGPEPTPGARPQEQPTGRIGEGQQGPPTGRIGEGPPPGEGPAPTPAEPTPPRPAGPGGAAPEVAPAGAAPEAAPPAAEPTPAPQAPAEPPRQRTFFDLMGGPREIESPNVRLVEPEAAPQPAAEPTQQVPDEIATAFSGAGTMEAALTGKRAGVVAEFDSQIVDAYNKAYGTKFDPTDVANLDPNQVAGKPFHASPVCKNFSAAKSARTVSPDDLASGKAVARIIDEAKPPSVTIENAPEYVDSVPFKEITAALDRQGYNYDVVVVDAADLGASQHRKRMILRAVPKGVELPPMPEKKAPGDWYKSIEDLIPADMQPIALPPNEQRMIDERVARGTLDPNKPILSMGGNKAFANAGGPAPALLASPRMKPRVIIPGKGMFALTPRMMARLMGLPDSYPLPDNAALAKLVLGNGIHGEVTRQVLEPVMDAGLKAKKAQAAPQPQAEAPTLKRPPAGREGEMGSVFVPSGKDIAEAAGRIGKGIANVGRVIHERIVQNLGNEANFIGKVSPRVGQKLHAAEADERRIGGALRSMVEAKLRGIDKLPNAKEVVAHAEDLMLDPKTGGYVNRLQNAHENLGVDDLDKPAGFDRVVSAYHDVVVESGRKLEEAGLVQVRTDGTLQRFTANENRRRFIRMTRPEFYQVLARPGSKAFEKLVDVLAKGNNVDPKVLAKGLATEREAIKTINSRSAERKVAADFSRSLEYFPAAIEVDGKMVQLLETDLQANFTRIADDSAMRYGIVNNIGNNITAEQAAAINADGKPPVKVMEDTYAEYNEDLKASGRGENLLTGYTNETLQGVIDRAQNLYEGTYSDPATSAMARVAAKIEGELRLAKLTVASIANLVEPAGTLPQYVGFGDTARAYRNVLKDAAKVSVGKAMGKDVHMQTRDAAVESGALITGTSARAFDSSRFHGKVIDALRAIASGGFEKSQAFAEIVAAEAGRLKVEGWKAGLFRASDEIALRSLDFTPEQIEAFRSGKFDDALGKAFIGRMTGEATSTRVGARKARLTSSKRFNLLFPFNRYFLGRAKSAARALLEFKRDPSNPATWATVARLLGATVLGGTLASYLMRSIRSMDPAETLQQMWREMTLGAWAFAGNQARAQLAGGPLMSSVYEFGNPAISNERFWEFARPIQIGNDIRDAFIGRGAYRGMTESERFSAYFSRVTAAVPVMETAASLAQLDNLAQDVQTIRQNVSKWARDNEKVRFYSPEPVEEKLIPFGKAVREAVEMLNRGKDMNSPEVKLKVAEALKIGPGENLRQAIKSFKVLTGKFGVDQEGSKDRKELMAYIGEENYRKLITYDNELETLAASIPTDTGLDDASADFRSRLRDAADLFDVGDFATIKSIKEDLLSVLSNQIAESRSLDTIDEQTDSSLLHMATLLSNYPDSYDAAFGEVTAAALRERGNRTMDVYQVLQLQAVERAKAKIKEQARGR